MTDETTHPASDDPMAQRDMENMSEKSSGAGARIQSMAEGLSERLKEKDLTLEDLQKDYQTLRDLSDDVNIIHNSIVAYLNNNTSGSTREKAEAYRDRMLAANREQANDIYEKYGLDGESINTTAFLDDAIKKLSEAR